VVVVVAAVEDDAMQAMILICTCLDVAQFYSFSSLSDCCREQRRSSSYVRPLWQSQ
jgi:predicted metal-binding membrane protein